MDDFGCLSRRDAVVGLLTFVAALAGGASDSLAAEVTLIGSHPAVDEIMDGSATSFALRFDGPVDHESARLMLIGPMGVRALRARLHSEPNTIFTAVGKLPAGDYELDWQVRVPSGHISEGRIPFHVAPW
jgi:copper resistance protein C